MVQNSRFLWKNAFEQGWDLLTGWAGIGFWFDHVACSYLSLWYIHAGQRYAFKRTHQLKPVVYLINQNTSVKRRL